MSIVSKYLIYALVDPRTQEWRYIGKSSSGLGRPQSHRQPAAREKFKRLLVYKWINKLYRLGLQFTIEILEEFKSSAPLNLAEKEWIAEARKQGCQLTNLTDGGDGFNTGYKMSEETKQKISNARKGRPQPWHQGVPLSQSAKDKLSNWLLSDKGKEKVLRVAQERGLSPIWDNNGVEYKTIREASKTLSISPSEIKRIIDGDKFFAKGLSFTNDFSKVNGLKERAIQNRDIARKWSDESRKKLSIIKLGSRQ